MVALERLLYAVLLVALLSGGCRAGSIEGGGAHAWVLDATGTLILDAAQGDASARITSSSNLEGKEVLFVTDQTHSSGGVSRSLPACVERLRVTQISATEGSQFAREGAVDVLAAFFGSVEPFALHPGTHIALDCSTAASEEALLSVAQVAASWLGLESSRLHLSAAATFASWGFLSAERPIRGVAAPAGHRYYYYLPLQASGEAGTMGLGNAVGPQVLRRLSVALSDGGEQLTLTRRHVSLEATASTEGGFSLRFLECAALSAPGGALLVSAPPDVSLYCLSSCAEEGGALHCLASSWSSGVRPVDGLRHVVPKFHSSSASLERRLDGGGFHRSLSTDGVLAEAQLCPVGPTEVALVERLSRDFFVDEYQVTELFRFGARTETLLDHVIDLEKPAAQSTQNAVVSYTLAGPSDGTFAAELPLHYRYQTPSTGAEFSESIISAPSLLVKCAGEEKWRHVATVPALDAVAAAIPVGDLQAKPLVTVVTLCWTVAGASVVLLLLWKQQSARS